MILVKLLALRTGRIHPPAVSSGAHICLRLSRFRKHIWAKRLKAMKNPSDPIGIRKRELMACREIMFCYAVIYVYHKVKCFDIYMYNSINTRYMSFFHKCYIVY
jgi:hypothetical protein